MPALSLECCAALYPIDTIKTRLQLMLKGGGFSALAKQGGTKNLYAGVWGNLVGVAPASAVFMGIYEPVKAAIAGRVSDKQSFLAPLGAGSAAGIAASVIRVPTEVVKQRLQSGGLCFFLCLSPLLRSHDFAFVRFCKHVEVVTDGQLFGKEFFLAPLVAKSAAGVCRPQVYPS